MRKGLLFTLAFMIVAFVVQSSCLARGVPHWPYEKLFQESDLVVLAALLKTEFADDELMDRRWSWKFEGQNTTFEKIQVLKGTFEENELQMLHFKIGEAKSDERVSESLINGPTFVTFPTTRNTDDRWRRERSQEYLLFLKKLPDGRFIPVSGQIDPNLSVRKVSAKVD